MVDASPSMWRCGSPSRWVLLATVLLTAIAAGGAPTASGKARSTEVHVVAPKSVVVGQPCGVQATTSARGWAVLQTRRGHRWWRESSARLKRRGDKQATTKKRVALRSATLECKMALDRAGRTIPFRVVVLRGKRMLTRSKGFRIRFRGHYLSRLATETYRSIVASVEPSTGLPHDKLDASLLDIVPQLATVRGIPYTSTGPSASLDAQRCTESACVRSGRWGLRLNYTVPSATFASYNINSVGRGFNASSAAKLELWARGEAGDRFEVVLWSDCAGGFPGRPSTALIEVGTAWRRYTVPMRDFAPYINPASICRVSLGFNDAIDPQGTVDVDAIRFLDASGRAPWLAPDEETNVTTIGLYMASVVGARSLGLETKKSAAGRLASTLASLEALPKYHGFPQTHNHVVSLTPSSGDRCISTVDSGNLAIGLTLVRQRFPRLADRASALLQDMDWSWVYDPGAGLPYGCRYPDGGASSFHYDYLMADSRLAHLLGIGAGGMPASSWNNLRRLHQAPLCAPADHLEPGWDGGGLFMAFLPGLFLRDRGELANSAAALVEDQICRASQIGAPEGAWGWSATAMPPYGEQYCGFGCQRDDVLVPHAPLLALGAHIPSVDRASTINDLKALERLGARTPFSNGARNFRWGFRASVNWQTGQVATPTLMLDQTMAFLSLVNYMTGGSLRAAACADPLVRQGTDAVGDYAGTCAH